MFDSGGVGWGVWVERVFYLVAASCADRRRVSSPAASACLPCATSLPRRAAESGSRPRREAHVCAVVIHRLSNSRGDVWPRSLSADSSNVMSSTHVLMSCTLACALAHDQRADWNLGCARYAVDGSEHTSSMNWCARGSTLVGALTPCFSERVLPGANGGRCPGNAGTHSVISAIR